MRNWRILTQDDMEELTRDIWDEIVRPEFPDREYPRIIHDNIKQEMEQNFGQCCYKRGQHFDIRYSYKLYNGLMTYEFVKAVIKHEVLHALDYLERDRSGHDVKFMNMLKEHDSCAIARFVNNPEREVFSNNPEFN